MKKIDAHAHIGEYGGWAGVSSSEESILKNMNEYEIEKTILCSANYERNEDTREMFESYPKCIIPLVYVNPLKSEKAISDIDYYIGEKGFQGIKINPLRDAFVADDTCLDVVMEKAQEYKVPVFIHSGHPPYSLPWSIALLAERFPKVKVVMIHMGHGHGVYIDAALKMARRYENIYLEMSGMPMGCKIKEAYETVGADRIMFGTDSPFHHPSVEIQKVLTCGLEEEKLEDIFYYNALKLMDVRKE
ncbi:MAG: amidohydrolase family protein [Anaerostipes sp.]|nr:amidohydrolase family protein [Anaerostipes sp.]